MSKEYYTSNLDLALTEDGDLFLFISPLEPPQMTLTGDTIIGTTDMGLVKGATEISQNINVRLKTNLLELMLHEKFGNRLLDIIGKRNTRQNAELGKIYLRDTILRENSVINPEHLTIDIMPVSPEKIMYIVRVLNGILEPIKIVLELDLKDGIRRLL